MKKLMLVLVMLVGLGQSGCAFLGGAAVGAGGTGAAYEYNAYRQMQKLEEDYKAERISRREYEERADCKCTLPSVSVPVLSECSRAGCA